MEKTMLKINYRTLSGGEHSPWLQTSTLDEIVWGGAYELMFASDDGSHGLPFRFTQDEKVTLIVNDNNKGNTHGMHTIVQRLTYVEHATCDLVTYTRTRRDGNGKHQWSEWSVLDGATTSMLQDGSVTAQKLSTDVREKVDNPLRPLFIAAGALYNDTNSNIERTAFWGENVQHLPGHYYLNGLGNITEEEMMEIYQYKNMMDILKSTNKIICPFSYPYGADPRTFFKTTILQGANTSLRSMSFARCNNLVALSFAPQVFKGTPVKSSDITLESNSTIVSCSSLRAIEGNVYIKNTSCINSCPELEYVNMVASASVDLQTLPKLNKQSILYIINNFVVPNTAYTTAVAFTVTFAPDVYSSLFSDPQITTALEAKNAALSAKKCSLNLVSA